MMPIFSEAERSKLEAISQSTAGKMQAGKALKKANRKEAKKFANKAGMPYGQVDPPYGKWYVGTVTALKKIGVRDVLTDRPK